MAQVVENLLSKSEALSSNPSSLKKIIITKAKRACGVAQVTDHPPSEHTALQEKKYIVTPKDQVQ
jgi:hypothetical protein